MNTRRAKAAVLAGLAVLAVGTALAQVAVSPWKSPHVTFTDQNGVALAGGCVFTYTGGTSTPLATYTDSTGSTPNANPVILDSTGSAQIWLGPSNYKFAIWSTGGTNCATGTLEWTVDMVPGNLFNNTTVTGGTWSGGTITGAAISGGTITGAAITTSTLDSSPVGQTTPSTGRFTSLAAGFDSMAFSSTPVFPAGTYGYFALTLTNNVTSSTITGATNGQLITFDICENGTGGYTFAWPANLLGAPAINQNANGCTIAQAFFNGADWITTYSTSAVQSGIYNTMTFSATPVYSAGAYSYFTMTLTANVTSSTISGGVAGQIISIDLCQNATGGYTNAWPANLLNPPAIGPGANTCTAVPAVFNGTNWIAGFGSPTLAHAIVFADLSNTTYGASAIANLFVAPVAGTVPAAGAGTYNGVAATSKCTLMTAATASTTFTLKDGSSTFGTVVFAASGTVGSFTISAAFPVASGDTITVNAPASADATAAGLNCSLVFAY